ncbi:MAG: FHA domain-containing protein [Thermodesulfovibrionales bacterium]
MAFIKKCPICKSLNSPADMMCKDCLGDISGINPSEDAVLPVGGGIEEDDKTIVRRTEYLVLNIADGKQIKAESGNIIGRNDVGKEVLADYKTVSRQHARIIYEDGKWYIEDLDSSNGTYVNGVRIPPHKKTELSAKQRCSLSTSCNAIIGIE